MSQFVLHPGAVQDLHEIWEYVASDSPDAADQFVEESFPPNKRKRLPTFLLVAFIYAGNDLRSHTLGACSTIGPAGLN